MLKSLKTLTSAFVVMSVLAGCTSTNSSSPTDAELAAAAEADRQAAEAQAQTDADTAASLAAEQAKCDNAESVFYFDFDQSLLQSDARSALVLQAECHAASGDSIRLEGHADERGSREYNMALGEDRANAVRDFLVLQGVSSSSIESVSYGEERPNEVGSSESSWSKNRRVEFK
jgi:peptidoglycan-associated lipoprotein